jgi:chemosensory pili system protein ChpC
MAAVMAEELSELSCVLIPLDGLNLLLPNVSVAEILPWRRVKVLNEAPDWCLGLLGWRGETIPVVRFEALNGGGETARKAGRCMIVMNRARSATGLPFYALAAEGLPRMLQLTADDLSNQPGRLGPAESVGVRLGTESAVIPNLDFIESQIATLIR